MRAFLHSVATEMQSPVPSLRISVQQHGTDDGCSPSILLHCPSTHSNKPQEDLGEHRPWRCRGFQAVIRFAKETPLWSPGIAWVHPLSFSPISCHFSLQQWFSKCGLGILESPRPFQEVSRPKLLHEKNTLFALFLLIFSRGAKTRGVTQTE